MADASNSFTAASLNDSSEAATAAVVACPSGSYKSGWNLDSCTSCGVGLLTDPISATSSDNCFLPPGYGSKLDANSSTAANSSELSHLIAERCTKGTYGSESKTYGLEPRPCQVSCTLPLHTVHDSRMGFESLQEVQYVTFRTCLAVSRLPCCCNSVFTCKLADCLLVLCAATQLFSGSTEFSALQHDTAEQPICLRSRTPCHTDCATIIARLCSLSQTPVTTSIEINPAAIAGPCRAGLP